MKKFIGLMLAALFSVGCGGDAIKEERTTQQPAPIDSHILVVYFSRAGNVSEGADAVSSASINEEDGIIKGNAEILAEYASDITGGDLFFIETVKKYPAEYEKTTDTALEEKEEDVHPELMTAVENMEDYDKIILVYPIWWGSLPQAVKTFLESYDLSGKTIIPIATNEGSDTGDSEEEIKALAPDAVLTEGLSVRGSDVKESLQTVEDFLNNAAEE